MHIRQLSGILPQRLRFNVRRMLYAGPGQKCPLCRTSVRKFVGHGGGEGVLDLRRVVGGMLRENDSCPVCHGCDRTRLMMFYLESVALGRFSKARILHIAPDQGLYLWLGEQECIEYTASDLDLRRYRHIKNLKFADITSLPFENDSFDIVICSHVLEHVPNDRLALDEIHRVLGKGGLAMLLAPFAMDGKGTDEDPSVVDPKARRTRFGQWDHVRIYDRDDFVGRVSQSGFETTLFDAYALDPTKAEELHLNREELLPVGTKLD